jgi:hypothetical protein
MRIGLAEQLEHDMRRGRALEAQRRAAGVLLERYAAAPTLARWARLVLRSDEVKPYRLLYRVAERVPAASKAF